MLEKIRNNRLKSSLATALAAFIAAIILWPLLDLFWAKVLTHSDFTWTVMDHIVDPAIFSVIFGIITCIFWKKETKIEKKSKETN